jgi:DNA-binding transcriptional LysR family regulator
MPSSVRISLNRSTLKHHLDQIKIAYVGAVMHSIMPKVLVRLQQNFPKINATLLEAGNEDQIEGLRSGSIDIGFVRMPMTLEDLEIMPVYSETFSIILSGTHRLIGTGILRLEDLAEEPFISFCRSCAPEMVDMI